MEVWIEPGAAAFLQRKGGEVLIYLGGLSGCCTTGSLPYPAMEVSRPRRNIENYQVVEISGIKVYLSQEAAAWAGRAEITLNPGRWWKTVSFKYFPV